MLTNLTVCVWLAFLLVFCLPSRRMKCRTLNILAVEIGRMLYSLDWEFSLYKDCVQCVVRYAGGYGSG